MDNAKLQKGRKQKRSPVHGTVINKVKGKSEYALVYLLRLIQGSIENEKSNKDKLAHARSIGLLMNIKIDW